MTMTFLSHGEQFDFRSTAQANASPFIIASPYLLTHAFLI
jgi:hypothetical protein